MENLPSKDSEKIVLMLSSQTAQENTIVDAKKMHMDQEYGAKLPDENMPIKVVESDLQSKEVELMNNDSQIAVTAQTEQQANYDTSKKALEQVQDDLSQTNDVHIRGGSGEGVVHLHSLEKEIQPVQENMVKTVSHAERVFPPFDFSYGFSHIFWLLVSFGLFYLFIARIIAPRIGSIIETRRSRIAADFDQAMRLQQEAEEMIALYEKELGDARARSAVIAQEAADDIKIRFEQERKENEVLLKEKLAESEKYIASISQKAMQNIDLVAQEIAQEAVEKVLGRPIAQTAISDAVKAAAKSGE